MTPLSKQFFPLAVILLMLTAFGCQQNAPREEQHPSNKIDTDDQKSASDMPISLQLRLDSMKNRFEQKASEEKKRDYAQGVSEVDDLGLVKSASDTGDDAFMFELPSATGESIKLGDLLKQGPVVLIWYRGGWCPYCNLQLRTMQQYLPQIKELGANLVAISPEMPDSSISTKEKDELSYYVLSDKGNKVAKKYGIVYTLPEVVQKQFEGRIDVNAYNGDNKKELPLAVTYVVDTNGKITYAFLNSDYKKRAEPEEIIKALKDLK